MGRTIWFAIVVMVFALCWGTIIIGVGSLSVAYSQISTAAVLSQLGPEYQFSASAPQLHLMVSARRPPA